MVFSGNLDGDHDDNSGIVPDFMLDFANADADSFIIPEAPTVLLHPYLQTQKDKTWGIINRYSPAIRVALGCIQCFNTALENTFNGDVPFNPLLLKSVNSNIGTRSFNSDEIDKLFTFLSNKGLNLTGKWCYMANHMIDLVYHSRSLPERLKNTYDAIFILFNEVSRFRELNGDLSVEICRMDELNLRIARRLIFQLKDLNELERVYAQGAILDKPKTMPLFSEYVIALSQMVGSINILPDIGNLSLILTENIQFTATTIAKGLESKEKVEILKTMSGPHITSFIERLTIYMNTINAESLHFENINKLREVLLRIES